MKDNPFLPGKLVLITHSTSAIWRTINLGVQTGCWPIGGEWCYSGFVLLISSSFEEEYKYVYALAPTMIGWVHESDLKSD